MGKYITLFNNHSGYTAFTQTEDFIKPNVSHCVQENDVHYNPYDYSDRYLTFIALEDGSEFSFTPMSSNTISYSIDDGETWVTLDSTGSTTSIDSGEKIMWKGEMTSYMDVTQNLIGVGTFSSTNYFMGITLREKKVLKEETVVLRDYLCNPISLMRRIFVCQPPHYMVLVIMLCLGCVRI